MRHFPIRWLWWTAGALLIALVAWSFVPRPVSVETARVARGPIVVTVDEDAKTRVRDRYTVSAPVSGYLLRIPHRAGAVVRDRDPLARIVPGLPVPIDARTRSELEARAAAAADVARRARLQLDAARVTLAQADRELERHRQLERDRVISAQELDVARTRQQVARSDADAAATAAEAAAHELDAARAALLPGDAGRRSGVPTLVQAPRGGAVLRVFEESERMVQAGTPLLELGEPDAMEIVAELLSTDAVRVQPGARVFIDRWGGDAPLNGRVRLVEPSSFTKISALGVEEQRVNVIVDFTDPPECWKLLGDRFAVEVRVVTWQRDAAVKVPVSALFRRGTDWAVYKVAGGRAAEQRIRIAARNDAEAAVDAGLDEGDVVIVHPSDRVRPGTRLAIR